MNGHLVGIEEMELAGFRRRVPTGIYAQSLELRHVDRQVHASASDEEEPQVDLWRYDLPVGLVAGIDCSTQSTKVLVVDSDSGTVVAMGVAPHSVTGTAGARETDPGTWEDALEAALAATGRAHEVDAVSIAAQQHGLVVVDGVGHPLRPAVLWNDTRSALDARTIVAAGGGAEAVARRCGSVPSASFTITTWAWLRRTEPGLIGQIRGVRLPHDHLNACLTGVASTDRSDVSGTGWWSPSEEEYAFDLLDLPSVGLPPELLPRVLGPLESAGTVTRSSAVRFGLRPGIVVGPGAADNAAGALPLDLGHGEAAISLGTSGTVYATSALPSADPTGTVAGFASADGRYLPLACTLNATLAVDRTAEWLGVGRQDVEPAGTVVYLPWLDGERTPNAPDASGAMSGLRHDTTRGAILQAAYDGIVATLLGAARVLEQWAPQDVEKPLLLLGGGAKGPVWQDTIRRLSGRPVFVPDTAEPVALGAAMQAAACAGEVSLATVSERWSPRQGRLLAPVSRDTETLKRISAWQATVLAR